MNVTGLKMENLEKHVYEITIAPKDRSFYYKVELYVVKEQYDYKISEKIKDAITNSLDKDGFFTINRAAEHVFIITKTEKEKEYLLDDLTIQKDELSGMDIRHLREAECSLVESMKRSNRHRELS